MDPEPDSSRFVASKSEPGVSPSRKTKNTSGVCHRPHQIVTKKKKSASFLSKDKKKNQKKKEALNPRKRKTKKGSTNPPKNQSLRNPRLPKTSSTDSRSEISKSPSSTKTTKTQSNHSSPCLQPRTPVALLPPPLSLDSNPWESESRSPTHNLSRETPRRHERSSPSSPLRSWDPSSRGTRT